MKKKLNNIIMSVLGVGSFALYADTYSPGVELSGVVKVDQRFYVGKARMPENKSWNKGLYYSGAQVRDVGLGFKSLWNEKVLFKLGISFSAAGKNTSVDEAALVFSLPQNAWLSVGQINPGFCRGISLTSKWLPFLERSLPSVAFGICPGLGVNIHKHNDNHSATIAVSQPKADHKTYAATGIEEKQNDRWQITGRYFFSPVAEDNRVVQFGISGHYRDHNNKAVTFASTETSSRNTEALLNTEQAGINIVANKQNTLDIEFAALQGPVSGEIEYQTTKIKRGQVMGVSQGENLRFHGYHAQFSYVLTGESRAYDRVTGTFGQVVPENKPYGALEASVRFSHLSLNNKDIQGGRAHNLSTSISWYINKHARVIAEYVRSKQQRQYIQGLDKRTIHSVGLRAQIGF